MKKTINEILKNLPEDTKIRIASDNNESSEEITAVLGIKLKKQDDDFTEIILSSSLTICIDEFLENDINFDSIELLYGNSKEYEDIIKSISGE